MTDRPARPTAPGRVPEAVPVVITGIDADGDAVARPIDWPESPTPIVFMRPERRDQPALVPGERVLASLRPIGRGRFDGRTLRRLSAEQGRLLGVFRPNMGGGGRIEPVDRRVKAEWRVPAGADAGAEAGELVVAAALPHRGGGLAPAQVVERLGRAGSAASVSLIALHGHDIPTEFPAAASAEADAAGPAGTGGREDLRGLDLVTIDGADARDFDDAVWAERTPAGFRIIVAIADVAHYVPAGGALDQEARRRGNSVYFPDRVVPMLPEALSAGWCSLLPGAERPCVAVEISIDAAGRKTGHRFGRALMRSAARLTYEQAQEGREAGDALGSRLADLFAAADCLLSARRARGALDLDVPERVVTLRGGEVASMAVRARLGSHRVIEELMILANVAAAETLEGSGRACLYRVHAPPTDGRLAALRGVLHGLGIGLAAAGQVHPRDLARVIERASDTPMSGFVKELVLRSQSQAAYDAANIGHFGLAQPRYAHFTSPIRRYADLVVHRALLGEADGGLDGLGAHLSATERRAAEAEQDARERYAALYLRDAVGAVQAARVTGLQRFGIFATLLENGATGLVPTSRLGDDVWVYDPRTETLSGRHSKMTFRLAQDIDVRLTKVDALTGALTFDVADRSGHVA